MALADNKTKIQALLDGINALPDAGAGEPKLQQKTVTPATTSQSVTPDSGYDGLSKVTVNAMPTATQATPSISVSSGGLITASATQTAGYVAAGTKTMTQQMTTQAAQTITPGTSNKTIASGRYLTGTQTIKGDANLIAANIKKGVSIFGIAGALESGGAAKVEFLTWTPSTNTYGTVTLQHSLGVVPDGYLVVQAQEQESTVEGAYSISCNFFDVGLSAAGYLYIAPCFCVNGFTVDSTWYEAENLGAFVSDLAITFGVNMNANRYVYPAGSTYNVLVYKR